MLKNVDLLKLNEGKKRKRKIKGPSVSKAGMENIEHRTWPRKYPVAIIGPSKYPKLILDFL